MKIDSTYIENIYKTSLEIIETAENVNRLSHERKQITRETLMLISEMVEKNSIIGSNYRQVFKSLENYILEITNNINDFKPNIGLFQDIVSAINSIQDQLINISSKITRLTDLINIVKKDTEDINILATNASIVSSKYGTPIFQVLSNKFNSIANYINHNLETIINYITPIQNGIESLVEINTLVISDINSGYHNFLLFLEKLSHQENVVEKQVQKAELSKKEIEGQKDMLADINTQIFQMDSDADKAIEGSGNVKKIGESIKDAVDALFKNNGGYFEGGLKNIDFISGQGSIINKTATTVNTKSKSQLDFSYSSLKFCKSIIDQSQALKNTVTKFNKQSFDNNELAIKISTSVGNILAELKRIENRIIESNESLIKFIDDYLSINNILDILKAILNMMQVLSIYSRIEASRDPIEYEGFLTIAKNIQKLQNKIKNNLPKIKHNIKETNTVIDAVNISYRKISELFYKISDNSISFADRLTEISKISTKTENFSKVIYEESLNLDLLLNDLENYLNKLIDVVKEPIEGSANNIKRGKFIEEKSKELKEAAIV